MKLNCKPGDLAVIFKGMRNVGRLVECLALTEAPSESSYLGSLGWAVRTLDGEPIRWTFSYFGEFAPDDHLKPIRDNDGEDETLQWLEVPRKVEA